MLQSMESLGQHALRTCKVANYLRIWAAPRKLSANGSTLFANGEGRSVMILRMGNPVYAIDEFPDDDLPWCIEWIGGVGYNTSVPSEPRSMFAWRSAS